MANLWSPASTAFWKYTSFSIKCLAYFLSSLYLFPPVLSRPVIHPIFQRVSELEHLECGTAVLNAFPIQLAWLSPNPCLPSHLSASVPHSFPSPPYSVTLLPRHHCLWEDFFRLPWILFLLSSMHISSFSCRVTLLISLSPLRPLQQLLCLFLQRQQVPSRLHPESGLSSK